MPKHAKPGEGGAVRSLLNLFRFGKKKKLKGQKVLKTDLAEPPSQPGPVLPEVTDAGPSSELLPTPEVIIKTEGATTSKGADVVSNVQGAEAQVESPRGNVLPGPVQHDKLLEALESTADANPNSTRMSFNAVELSNMLFAQQTNTQSGTGLVLPARLAEGLTSNAQPASGLNSGEGALQRILEDGNPCDGSLVQLATTTVAPLHSVAINATLQDSSSNNPLYGEASNLQDMLYADYDTLDRLHGRSADRPSGTAALAVASAGLRRELNAPRVPSLLGSQGPAQPRTTPQLHLEDVSAVAQPPLESGNDQAKCNAKALEADRGLAPGRQTEGAAAGLAADAGAGAAHSTRSAPLVQLQLGQQRRPHQREEAAEQEEATRAVQQRGAHRSTSKLREQGPATPGGAGGLGAGAPSALQADGTGPVGTAQTPPLPPAPHANAQQQGQQQQSDLAGAPGTSHTGEQAWETSQGTSVAGNTGGLYPVAAAAAKAVHAATASPPTGAPAAGVSPADAAPVAAASGPRGCFVEEHPDPRKGAAPEVNLRRVPAPKPTAAEGQAGLRSGGGGAAAAGIAAASGVTAVAPPANVFASVVAAPPLPSYSQRPGPPPDVPTGPTSRPMKLTTACLAAYTTLYDNGGDQSFQRALQRKMQLVYKWLQASDLTAPPDPRLEIPLDPAAAAGLGDGDGAGRLGTDSGSAARGAGPEGAAAARGGARAELVGGIVSAPASSAAAPHGEQLAGVGLVGRGVGSGPGGVQAGGGGGTPLTGGTAAAAAGASSAGEAMQPRPTALMMGHHLQLVLPPPRPHHQQAAGHGHIGLPPGHRPGMHRAGTDSGGFDAAAHQARMYGEYASAAMELQPGGSQHLPKPSNAAAAAAALGQPQQAVLPLQHSLSDLYGNPQAVVSANLPPRMLAGSEADGAFADPPPGTALFAATAAGPALPAAERPSYSRLAGRGTTTTTTTTATTTPTGAAPMEMPGSAPAKSADAAAPSNGADATPPPQLPLPPAGPVSVPGRTKTIAVASHCPSELQPQPASAPWTIDDFSLLKKLYEGNLSVVCQAQHRRSGRHVALKIYKRSRLHEMERFQLAREICLHIRIVHPHVVALFAAWKDAKYVYLALDWAPLGNMFDYLLARGGRLGEGEAARVVMRPLLAALAFLHSQHFIHRDVKLENLLLDGSSYLKLADFGLAIDQKFEQANTRLGTFGYFAPEVLDCPLKKGPFDMKDSSTPGYDSRVDVWSAGVVGYEVLTGRAPFSASSPAKIIQAIRTRVLEFPGISDEGRDFLRSALTRDPAARPTARQLLDHPWIARHCGAGGGASDTNALPPQMPLAAAKPPPALELAPPQPPLAASAAAPLAADDTEATAASAVGGPRAMAPVAADGAVGSGHLVVAGAAAAVYGDPDARAVEIASGASGAAVPQSQPQPAVPVHEPGAPYATPTPQQQQ